MILMNNTLIRSAVLYRPFDEASESSHFVVQPLDAEFLRIKYCSNPSKSNTILARTETPAAMIAYNKVTFQPKVTHINPTIMGLSNGETNKKVSVGPNPAFADNPRNIGTVEQLQKGVTAPSNEASRYPLPFLVPSSAEFYDPASA